MMHAVLNGVPASDTDVICPVNYISSHRPSTILYPGSAL